MVNFIFLLYSFRKILRLPINNRAKQKLVETHFLLSISSLVKPPQPLNVVGYQVNFSNLKTLKYLFYEIFVGNEYFFSETTQCPLIIDCGSNIGMSILFFNYYYPGCRIIAFEPDENTYSILEKNIKQNKLENVELYKQAVTSKDGVVNFYYDQEKPGSLTMSTHELRMPKQRKEVKSTKLSYFINEDVRFLKLDVEGSETEVIEELKKEDKLRYINQMVIEYHHHIEKNEDSLSRILLTLEDSNFGYQLDCQCSRPWKKNKYQDVLIYAYRK